MKIYADTSVFGGLFDPEFSSASQALFDEIESGRFILVTSALVEAEIEPAPMAIRAAFAHYTKEAEIAAISREALMLQQAYLSAGVVTAKSTDDALHVATATVSGCTLIVSWNFKHIVHFDKIPKYNAVNTLEGFGPIGIFSPLEVICYDNEL
ncbi:MAG: type II toxin-antitoxin system VapC family toxin [Lamprobacter sp.]|uniref:type II toxin-antitoxin system VapC family toxin n=1 Tax=Lamprobacter sp. TaxID=3100796 RepID=UPI002B25C726|nr:type II toxin-antitoxin system VapC family toxin [Lamprobacter sp.]MEA3638956.1 type II toxin-antitoxin system VapC family toxin [Lamprobacter sp.]